MAEYIDREALFAEFDRLGLGEHSIVEKVFSIGVRTIIAGMPAADVAPVVRCRDCKHSYEDLGGLYCSFGPCVDCPVSSDFWCANGKRRENAHAQD